LIAKTEQDKVPWPPDGPRIGLCLSGGGFRAALYALGVVEYLADAGRLANLDVVSAVSGGSVAASVLADRWPTLAAEGYSRASLQREVCLPFETAVSERNLRNRALARWAGRRFTLRGPARGSVLGQVLVDELLQARRVVDLDPALQVVLTSTDLSTGRAFRVSRDFIGSYDFGYHTPPPELSLGEAVAASAAVPLLFPPVYLHTRGLGLTDAPPTLSLVDGGVYDNLGLEWFQGWSSGRPAVARGVDFIIVVDASGVLEKELRHFRGVAALNRTREIQYFQTRAARIRWYVDALFSGDLRGVHLASKYDPAGFRLPDGTPIDPTLYEGALPQGFAKALSTLRTDLDRFSTEEARLLRYHGYWSTHARLASLYPELGASKPSWREYADLSERDTDALFAVLAQGARRKFAR